MTIESDIRQLYDEDQDIESVIRLLRYSGFNKFDSVKLIVKQLSISLRDANKAIHTSPTWHDTQQDDEALQEMFLNTLNSLNSDEFK